MNEEKRFDELLSSKLSEREFHFDELNWDKAERLIMKQESRRKIFRFSLVFSGGLAAGIAIMLPFVLNTHTATLPVSNAMPTGNKNPVAQNSVSAPANPIDENLAVKNVTKEVKARIPVQSAFVKKNNITGTRAASSNLSPGTKVTKRQPMIIATNTSKITHKLHSHRITNPSIVASAVKTNTPIHTKAINSEESGSTQEQITDVNPSPGNIANTVLTPAPPPGIKSNTVANTTPANSNNQNNISVTNNSLSTKTTSVIKNSEPLKNVPGKSATSMAKKDSANSNNTAMIPGTKPNYGEYTANILSVYGGFNYSLGWTNNGIIEGSGFTPVGGLVYTHYYTVKISSSIGIGYSELNHLDKTYTSSIIQYDFGQNSQVTTVTPKRVYYLAFPFSLHYNFNGKNIVSGGIDFLFLINTSSTIATYQQNAFAEIPGSSVMQGGYVQGFSNLDFQLTLAYTHIFTDKLGLTGEYYHGLSYVENDAFPGVHQYVTNQGFKFVLSYQLMK